MQLMLRKKHPGEIEYGIIYGTIAAIALVAARCLPVQDLLPGCAFRGLIGLPCPTCGMTRSLVSLAQGDLGSAISLNPLVVIVLLAAFAALVANLVVLAFRLPRPSVTVSAGESTAIRLFALGTVLLNWLFLVLSD